MTYKTDFMIFNCYARSSLETCATRAASLRSFRRWLEKFWSLISSLSASGQRYVVLGRNSLKPFDLISPDLYKISVKGLLSTSVRASFVFSSWELEVHPSTKCTISISDGAFFRGCVSTTCGAKGHGFDQPWLCHVHSAGKGCQLKTHWSSRKPSGAGQVFIQGSANLPS